MTAYAIRFRPRDPTRRDEPAAYLSTDMVRKVNGRVRARVTSVASDLWDGTLGHAERLRGGWAPMRSACDMDNAVADVVPLADALADLAS